VRHLSCPSCGGTLAFKEGSRVSTCPSCGSRSIVEIQDHIPKYVIEPNLDLKAAKVAARRLLSDEKLAPDIKKQARFYDAGLYYIPIYELTAQRVGKLVTVDIVREHEVTKETTKANVIMRDIQHQAPAVKLGEWGIENIRLNKLRQIKPLESFDPTKLEKDSHVFDSTMPAAATELGRKGLGSSLGGDETRLLKEKIKLVFCPVWLIKYTYRNRLYRLVLDGVTGKVLFGRAPARDTERIPIMIAALLFITYPIAQIIRGIVTGSIAKWGEFLIMISIPAFIVFTAAVFLLAMAWNQFRYSGEVVWRGDTVEIERVNKPPETRPERMARLMMSFLDTALAEIKVERENRWYGTW